LAGRKTTKSDLVEAIKDKGPLNAKEVHGLVDALFEEINGAILA
jgi:nucleoid DNA-binding protein